jgi:hypothetical protein
MPIPDQLAHAPYSTPEEVYELDPDDVAQMQLEGLQARFEELRPELPVVSSLASDVGVERISRLEDVVPLFLPPASRLPCSVSPVSKTSGRSRPCEQPQRPSTPSPTQANR